MATVYSWRDGFPVKVGADVAAAEFERIRGKHGIDDIELIPPEVIVQESKPKGAKLHDSFEWDDARCGELHRLKQARDMKRALLVVQIDRQGHELGAPTPVYVHLKATKSRPAGYAPVELVVKHADLLAEAIGSLGVNVKAALRSYTELVDYAKRAGKMRGKHGSIVTQLGLDLESAEARVDELVEIGEKRKK